MGDFVKWGKVRALMYQSIQKPNHVAHLNPPLPPPHAPMYPVASYRRFAPQRKATAMTARSTQQITQKFPTTQTLTPTKEKLAAQTE